MKDLFLARQPIFDRNLELYGYELLYRTDNHNYANITNPSHATAHTLSLGLIEIGLENLVGKHKAFINMSPDYILETPDLAYPMDQVILEISDSHFSDKDATKTLELINSKNYTVALDGVYPSSNLLKYLPAANIIKVDINKCPADQLAGFVTTLKKHPVKLIAEKVQDGDQIDQLLELGFDYLQGFFFSQPIISKSHSLSSNQIAVIDLLSKVHNADISTEELEDAITQDVTLSYHLLKYLNSAFFSLPNSVDSIRQAVIYLGRKEIKTWITIISMADHNSKPAELITTALVRARFCESLAKSIDDTAVDSYFTVGLLSVLDALMDRPITEIISELPLTDNLLAALSIRSGIMGSALDTCIMLEQGNWDDINFPQISAAALNMQYQTAIQWADDVVRNLAL